MRAFFKAVKKRLMFTGWLQYLPPIVASVLLFFFCLILRALSLTGISDGVLALAVLLMAIALFDLITVKYDVKPREKFPPRRDGMNAFDLMRARRACRSFQQRRLLVAHREELLDYAGRINDPDNKLIGTNPIRFEYVDFPLTVWPVVGAQEFLVAIAPRTYNRQSVIDVGRNLQKVVHFATRMGLATCWIGPGADQSSIVKHLGERYDPGADHIICVCAIGYKSGYKPIFLRLMQKMQHRRLPLSSLFYTDPYFKDPVDEEKFPFNHFGRCYEVCGWAPSSFNSQPTRGVVILDKERDAVVRVDFYAGKDSRYYAPLALGIWCANWETGCQELGIGGDFKVLSKEEVGADGGIPEYDVSWIEGN